MELRDGYKQTEIGNIPIDWEATTIGNNSKWMSGGTPRRNNVEFWSGSIPWISGSTLKNIEISTSDQFLTTEAVSAGSKMAPIGSTLLLVRGSALHNEIRAGLVVLPVAFNQDVKALVPVGELEPKFLTFYILGQSSDLLKLVSSAGNSAGVLDTKLVQNFKFLKPARAEQKAIVEALSDADVLTQSLQKLIAKKRQIKQGAMQILLNPFENGKLKAGWSAMKFGDIFNISGGFSASREQLSSDGFCYLHYGDIHGATKMFLDVDKEFSQIPKLNVSLSKISSKSFLNNGDIVFVDASEDDEGVSRHIVIINPNEIPFISGLHTIVVKNKSDTLDNKFKRYCFQTAEIKSQFKFFAVGTKVSGISKTNIAKININLPPLQEQTSIATILSDMDAEIAALETKLAKYQQIKQGMMQNLLTGRIRLV